MTRPEIRIGMRVSDNDWRGFGLQVLTVVDIDGDHAVLNGRWGTTRLPLRRIKTDGKPRRGWSVVP